MSFTLGDKTAAELGLRLLEDSDDPILPSTRDYTMTIPGHPGAWDFGADLEPKLFGLSCGFVKDGAAYENPSESELQQYVRRLSAHLLDQYMRPRTLKLIMHREPDKFYYARYSGSLSIQRLLYQSVGFFTLPLTAFDPAAYSIVANNEIVWGSEEIDFRMYYLMGTTGGKTHTITRLQTITETVNGNLAVRPTFIINGSATNVTFSANGKSFSLPSFTNAEWIIDGETWSAEKDGQNALGDMTGDFIELVQGDNDIEITGSGLNFTLDVRFRDRFS